MAQPCMLHAPLCHGQYFFLVFVYPIVTVFSSYVLDTNTCSCVASSALYTLTGYEPCLGLTKGHITRTESKRIDLTRIVPIGTVVASIERSPRSPVRSIILFVIISLVASGTRRVELLIWKTAQYYCFASTILRNTIIATKYMQVPDIAS